MTNPIGLVQLQEEKRSASIPVRAVVATGASPGSPEIAQRPDPEPGVGEVLVRVRAAGINNADLMQLGGGSPAPPGSPPDILGMEFAGEVVAPAPAPVGSRPGIGTWPW